MADTTVDATAQTALDFRSIRLGPVWTSPTNGYVIYIDDAVDLVYQKTTDGGANWGGPVVIKAGLVVKASIWFDKWTTGDAGTKIHIAYSDATPDDILYRSLDTSDDSLSAEITVFNGSSFTTGHWGSSVVEITKARGGNLYCGFWGDGSGEFGFYRSTDAGANWTSRAPLAEGNTPDGILLMPGNEADNQDIWCIYWDRVANELSLKTYDDSADSWSETLIATGMADAAVFYLMSAAPRHSDNHVILAAWTAVDTATADLKVWDINGSGSITAKTNVVTDLAESGQVAVLINQQNDDIYIAYLKGGTWTSTVDVKYKKSTDGGGAWGAEQDYSEAAASDLRAVWAGISVGDDGGKFQPAFFNDDLDDLFVNTVNAVDIAAAVVEGETRSLAGDQPAATGILARVEQGLRAVAGSQPTATGVLAKVLTAFKSLTGDQPASTGTLVRIEQALRALAGDQPTATGLLTRVFGRPRSVEGSQPTATGELTRVEQAVRALAGDQPAPTGILASVWEGVRALAGTQPTATGTLSTKLTAFKSQAGDQPASTGVLVRIEQALRTLAGSQPSATGALAAVLTVVKRDLAGVQPAATGALTHVEKAIRAVAGSQPTATGVLSTLGTFARALTGVQPSATGALTRSQAFSESLAGDQPSAIGALDAVLTTLPVITMSHGAMARVVSGPVLGHARQSKELA